MHDEKELSGMSGDDVLEQYIKNGGDNKEEIIPKLRNHLENISFDEKIIRALGLYDDIHFLEEYFYKIISDVDKVEAIIGIYDVSAVMYTHLMALYRGAKENRETVEMFMPLIKNAVHRYIDMEGKYFGEICLCYARLSHVLGDFDEEMYALKGGNAKNTDCKILYGSYVIEAENIDYSSGDAVKWYRASRYLPRDVEEKLVNGFWLEKMSVMNGMEISDDIDGEFKKTMEEGELFRFKSPFVELYKESYYSAKGVTESRTEEKQENKKGFLRRLISFFRFR